MIRWLGFALLVAVWTTAQADEYAEKVCGAYEVAADKAACFAEFQTFKPVDSKAAEVTKTPEPRVAPAPEDDRGSSIFWSVFKWGMAIGFVYWLYTQLRSAPSSTRKTPQTRHRKDIDAYLAARWEMAEACKASGKIRPFPAWYFDEATPAQIRKIGELPVSHGIKSDELTKGQASDLIGWFFEPDDDDLEVLELFDEADGELNQTVARHKVMLLLDDPDNKKKWSSYLNKELNA